MRKTACVILCVALLLSAWLWVVISICQPDAPQVSYYTPDAVETYTTGSFDILQIEKIYYLTEESSPDCISTADFQQYGSIFSFIDLVKEDGAGVYTYTAIFRETGPAS